MALQSSRQLLEKLKALGHGRGRSSPTDEGTEAVLLETIVEAIASQEKVQKEQATQLEFLTRAVKTHLLTDELAVYEAGKGREPVSQKEVVRVVERSQAGPNSVGFPDFGEGSVTMGADSDELAQMTMDSDKG